MKKKRIVSALLVVLVLFSMYTVAYADCTPTRAEAVQWLYDQNNAFYNLDDKYGAQCTDFVSAYMNWLYSGSTNPYQGYSVYDANQYPTVAGWNTSRWEVITNYTEFLPEPGDIFVSVGIDSYGHTGVVLESYSIYKAKVIDQNSVNPNYTSGHSAYIHDITWDGYYSPTYYIRYKNYGSVPATVSQRYQGSDYNEGWYEGEWSNGKPNGNGKLTYDDFGDGKYYTLDIDGTSYKALSYEGGFKDGSRNGQGVVIYEGGYREEGTYYGQWSANKTVFEGRLYKTTADSEGYWPMTTVATSSVAGTDHFGDWVYTKKPEPKTVPVKSITMSQAYLTIPSGDSASLSVSVSPKNATERTVAWRSSDESVVTVRDGKVTAVSAGTATIQAACGGVSADCKITVTEKTVDVQSVTLDQRSLEMKKGERSTLIATVFPENATESAVIWSSSDESVATVRDGKVTAVSAGTATIQAACGGKSAVCTVSVFEETSTDVIFPRRNVYHQGQFSDVPANQWYTDSVAGAFAFGLMTGTSVTTFEPYGEVTVAEAITMAARIHSIYTTGTEHFDQSRGSAWYQCYLDYAYENGIIGQDYYNSDVKFTATRSEYAEILANALPEEGLTPINRIPDGIVPDVNMKAWYAPSVYKLYRAGILTGSDSNGTFSPDTFITRAESAAIVSRIASSDLRVSFSLDK